MDPYKIAVLDIGKTNKKLIIYDQELKMCGVESAVIDEVEKDNLLHENLPEIEKWLIKSLRKFAGKFPDIRTVSVSTHGATFVCLGKNGKPAVPVISYTNDPGDDFHKDFFRNFGERESLQRTTGTPDFNLLINPGKGIWFTSIKYPDHFKNVTHILNYPQYFGYLLTGKIGVEPTYTGCHTYLWNFDNKEWSGLTEKMGIRGFLPKEVNNPWDILGKITADMAAKTGLNPETEVTLGIHDSNASLLPYLITLKEEFVLNSTGTWCVIMHEKEKVEFRDDELGKVVFYNIDAFSKPVKTAIFMGGLEFQSYIDILKKLNRRDELPEFNKELFGQIIRDRQFFMLPSVTKGTGQFPESEPRIIEKGKTFCYYDVAEGKTVPEFFHDFETAYAVLILSLVIQTNVSLERADMVNGMPLYIEGPFSVNTSYTNMIASLNPASETYISSLSEATAFGAAILSKASVEHVHPMELADFIHISKIKVPAISFDGFEEYIRAYLTLI
jgi:L-fuculokinase